MPTYEPSYAPSYVPRIRVEVYIPKRFASEYRVSLTWLIGELTETYGGCTVHENASGFYYSKSEAIIDEPMSVVYSDFDMDWDQPVERAEVLAYCARIEAVTPRQTFGRRGSNQRVSGCSRKPERFDIKFSRLHNS